MLTKKAEIHFDAPLRNTVKIEKKKASWLDVFLLALSAAIRNDSGYFYLNGNWMMEFSRSIRCAGTIFRYERKASSSISPESIFALGPTTEAIMIVLLYQEKNLGIIYEFSVPIALGQSHANTYNWNAGDFSDCS